METFAAFVIGACLGAMAIHFAQVATSERDRLACAREHNVFACQQVIEYRPLPATHDGEGKNG